MAKRNYSTTKSYIWFFIDLRCDLCRRKPIARYIACTQVGHRLGNYSESTVSFLNFHATIPLSFLNIHAGI